MNFGKRKITVQGEEVELDVKSELPIADISKDMDQVASQMAWWGSVWAAAEKEVIQADSHYKRWRAQAWLAATDAKPKPPEHMLKATVEADDKFIQYKEAMAQAAENVTLAKAVFNSFDKKSNQLQSKGARMRAELGATGMTTPETPKTAPAVKTTTPEGDDKAAAGVKKMKDLNRSKRTKGK